MSRKTAVAPFLILIVLLSGAYAAGAAEPCPPGACIAPTQSSVVQPVTSPSEFPVVVDGPPSSSEGKFGVLHAADGPTPFSWAALFAGATTVLLTLFVLVRNRRAFLNSEVESEPDELLEPAKSTTPQALVAQASLARER